MVVQEEGIGNAVEKYLRRFYSAPRVVESETNLYASVVGEVERRLISVTVEAVGGNRLKAARILGINRNTLLRKMRQFGLDQQKPPPATPGMRRRKTL